METGLAFMILAGAEGQRLLKAGATMSDAVRRSIGLYCWGAMIAQQFLPDAHSQRFCTPSEVS